MQGKYFIPFLLVITTLLVACAPRTENTVEDQTISRSHAESFSDTETPEIFPSAPPVDCPIPVPQDPPFVPPPPYDQLGFEGEFWYGSNSLWTAVRRNGTWEALPHNPDGYTQKVFWWREGYSMSDEPEPALTMTAERLDGDAPTVTGSRATNASAADIGSAMLVGIDLPTLGCWRIIGKYGEEELSFVVWVAP